MNTKQRNQLLFLAFAILLFSCKKELPSTATDEAIASSAAASARIPTGTLSTFATGLNDPRGLTFGPDGNLYVAEAGVGGTMSSAGFGCQQSPAPFGPYMGSAIGGRISKIDASGVRTTVSTNLPSSVSGIGDIFGPADVAFMGNTLYALVNAGCSRATPTIPSGIYRVNADGSTSLVADLSAWQHAHPVAHPSLGDFEPDGSWYNLEATPNSLYALEANHGELVRVGTDGSVSRVVDFSASFGHIVPTAMDYRGAIYIGNLGTFPMMPTSKIMKVSQDGDVEVKATGLSSVLGVVVDKNLTYVLEMTVGAPFPQPGAGRIIAIAANGEQSTVASGLTFPTAMTMGPDNNLYVLQWGFGGAPGAGMVSKVTLSR